MLWGLGAARHLEIQPSGEGNIILREYQHPHCAEAAMSESLMSLPKLTVATGRKPAESQSSSAPKLDIMGAIHLMKPEVLKAAKQQKPRRASALYKDSLGALPRTRYQKKLSANSSAMAAAKTWKRKTELAKQQGKTLSPQQSARKMKQRKIQMAAGKKLAVLSNAGRVAGYHKLDRTRRNSDAVAAAKAKLAMWESKKLAVKMDMDTLRYQDHNEAREKRAAHVAELSLSDLKRDSMKYAMQEDSMRGKLKAIKVEQRRKQKHDKVVGSTKTRCVIRLLARSKASPDSCLPTQPDRQN